MDFLVDMLGELLIMTGHSASEDDQLPRRRAILIIVGTGIFLVLVGVLIWLAL